MRANSQTANLFATYTASELIWHQGEGLNQQNIEDSNSRSKAGDKMNKPLRAILKALCPHRLASFLKAMRANMHLIPVYWYDLKRYSRFSAMRGRQTQAQYEAAITESYHSLEKGLSMSERRPGFGENVAASLLRSINAYRKCGFNENALPFQSALNSLSAYIDYRRDDGTTIAPLVLTEWEKLSQQKQNYPPAIIQKKKSDIVYASGLPFEEFCMGRHSVRNYSNVPVDETLIVKAINISRFSPSACNRQPARVYSIRDKVDMARVLELQGGNRGFGHMADCVLIVTADLQAFGGPRERNEAYIDGGMFAMSLLYALHHLQIGACALNWCAQPTVDRQLRQLVPIPDSEVVVLLVTVGQLPESFSVANSQRKDVDSIYKVCNRKNAVDEDLS